MKVITKSRQMGKTTDLVALLLSDPERCLLVYSSAEKERIKKRYNLPKSIAERIIPWFDAKRKLAGTSYKSITIDNADLFLEEFFQKPIDAVSITADGARDNWIKYLNL